ncbi:apolipoprotein N-acyltransferase [Planctomyces sp. SH-PL62]|uniref:apolipoprotein N-acyltransferase n=1 Tax=Planctomyces sp. SH-PL62 TaxID=1636152 RepID=UPI00078DEC4D|nr:apolipoprotein N-acyltransferase [Planctomyces sp. SH-PL62]AMV39936.1 Apolipoprotein N-acyltransferase [Planctomyces sp. SH-PL62]
MNAGTAVTQAMEEERRLTLSERASRHPIAAGMLSGFLLWSSFPPLEWSWAAWLALTPLFRLVVEPTARWRVYLGAWAGGLVFWLLSLQWVRLTDATAWSAWLTMALIFSAWWPGFLALTRHAVFKLEIPLLLAAPILWVGLEHVRAFLLSGFPWYYLGHSQYRALPLIQIADVTGALGISFLIVMVNALVVDLLTLPLLSRSEKGARIRPRQAARLWIVGLALVGTLAYGGHRLANSRFTEGPRIALLQTNFEQRYKSNADPVAILTRIEALALKATSRDPKPDLIAWPETSYPYGTIAIAPELPADAFERQVRQVSDELTVAAWRDKKQKIDEYLHATTDALGVPMIVGSLRYDHGLGGLHKFNGALLYQPGSAAVQSYDKIQLVPFGEYIPLLEALPWLTVFTPYHDGYVPSLTFGRETKALDVGGHRIAVGICFEDTVPHLIRRFFAEAPDGRQPDVLLDISNDGWFHGSEELDMHLAVSVFRSVENRVPLARAVNTGISALIDGDGRILQTLPRLTEGVLQAGVPLDDRSSLYIAWGDWLGITCLAVCIGLVPAGAASRRIRSRNRTGS